MDGDMGFRRWLRARQRACSTISTHQSSDRRFANQYGGFSEYVQRFDSPTVKSQMTNKTHLARFNASVQRIRQRQLDEHRGIGWNVRDMTFNLFLDLQIQGVLSRGAGCATLPFTVDDGQAA